MLKHGTGAINVATSRIPVADGDVRTGGFGEGNRPWVEGDIGGNTIRKGRPQPPNGRTALGLMNDDGWIPTLGQSEGTTTEGRWPANVIHDGSEEVLAAFPDAPGQMAAVRPNSSDGIKTDGIYGSFATNSDHAPRIETSKSAARFFYTAKANAHDRQGSKHPTVKPTDLMRYLVRLVTPPGGTVLDPFCGTGSTLLAADQLQFNAIGIEREAQYVADARHKFERDAGLFAQIAPE